MDRGLALQPGEVLADRYIVERALKSGGMGAVYAALDQHLGAKCAIKEMHEITGSFEDMVAMRKRFAEEARLLAVLSHPGIPRVRDYFDDGKASCFIVMDLILGSNLEQELSERKALLGSPFTPEQVVDDALEILDVLSYLHNQSPPMVHRDVKPANVIREHPSKRVKLVDFGLVRSLGGAQTQTSVGTLTYAPIEQLQGRAEPRSDLYALGATMFHLLTGTAPEFLRVPALSEAAPEIDRDLAAIVERAVADVKERPSDAREMQRALQQWKANRLQPEPVPSPLPPIAPAEPEASPVQAVRRQPPGKPSSPSGGGNAVRIGAACLMLGAVAAVPFLRHRSAPGDTPTPTPTPSVTERVSPTASLTPLTASPKPPHPPVQHHNPKPPPPPVSHPHHATPVYHAPVQHRTRPVTHYHPPPPPPRLHHSEGSRPQHSKTLRPTTAPSQSY